VDNPVLGGIDVCCDCVLPGACCFSADPDSIPESCAQMSPGDCAALGGSFHGSGSTCQGLGACCFGITGGACVVVDQLCCQDILGDPKGCGTSCSGDSDGDALDDRCECPADISGPILGVPDGVVGPPDLARVLGLWGPCPCCGADISGPILGVPDGVVGPPDLARVLGLWGPCP
jgi:hypothetical protein